MVDSELLKAMQRRRGGAPPASSSNDKDGESKPLAASATAKPATTAPKPATTAPKPPVPPKNNNAAPSSTPDLDDTSLPPWKREMLRKKMAAATATTPTNTQQTFPKPKPPVPSSKPTTTPAPTKPAPPKPATTPASLSKPPVLPKTSNAAPSSTPDLDDPSLPPWKREMLRKKMAAANATAPTNTQQPSPKPTPPVPSSKTTTTPAPPKPASPKPTTTPASLSKPPVPPKTSNATPSSTPDLDDPSLPPWKREMLRKKMAATNATSPTTTQQPSPKPTPAVPSSKPTTTPASPKPASPKPAPPKPASPKPASPKPTITPASVSKPSSSNNENNNDDDELSSLPPWKREIMLKKKRAAGPNPLKDSSSEEGTTNPEDDPSLPPWKREMLRKKRLAVAPSSPSGSKSAAATTLQQSPVQQQTSPSTHSIKSPSSVTIKSPVVSSIENPPSISGNESSGTPKTQNDADEAATSTNSRPPAPPIADANDGEEKQEEEAASIPPWKRELQQRRGSGNAGLLSPKQPPPEDDNNNNQKPLPPWKQELQARKMPFSPSSTTRVVDSSSEVPTTTNNDNKENNTTSPIRQMRSISRSFDDEPTMLDEDPTMMDDDPTMMPPTPPVRSQSVPQPFDDDDLSKNNSNIAPELQAIMQRRRNNMKEDAVDKEDDQQSEKEQFGTPTPTLAMQNRQQIAESKKEEKEEVIEEDEEEVIEEDEEEVIEEDEELEEELLVHEPEEIDVEDVQNDKEEEIQKEEIHSDDEAQGIMEDHKKNEEGVEDDDVDEKNEKTMENVDNKQLQNADLSQEGRSQAGKGGGFEQCSTAVVSCYETEMLDASEFSDHYFGERSKPVDDQRVDHPMGANNSVSQQRKMQRQGGYPSRRKSNGTTMSPYDFSEASRNVGLEREKADKRQIGGLLLVFSLCVACQPLGSIVGLIGPDGTTASEGVEYAMLIAGLVQVFFGSTGVFVGYLALVQDNGSHYLTRLLIFLTLLGFLPLSTDIADVWRGASELPKQNPFIPIEYKPSTTDIQFVGALGIMGIIAYVSSLFGSMFFSASALYVIQSGKHSTLTRSYYRGKLLAYSCLLVLAGMSQALVGIQVMDVAGSGPLDNGPVTVGKVYYVNFPELSIVVGIIQIISGLFGMTRYVGSLNQGEDDHRFQIFIGGQAMFMLVAQVIAQISYTGRDTDEEFAPSIAALSVGLNLFPAYLDYKMRTSPVDPSRDLFYSPPLESAEKEDTVLEEGSDHSRPNPGLERLKADRRQIGGLMLCFAICVVLQPLSSIAALIGPDGTTASRGVAYANLISGIFQVVFGVMGVFVGYLCLVQDQGNKHLTRLLIAIIQLAYIPFFTWIVDIGQQANTDPKDNPLIPAEYEPVSEDIRFVGAMGIFGVIAYSISFFGALAFTTFALYAFHIGKPESRSGLYYRSRLLFYATMLLLAGLSQILVGGQVLGVVGTGPLEGDPVAVAMYYVNFPELSIIMGGIQLFSGCFGIVRYARYKEYTEDDHRFQIVLGVQAFLILTLQIIVQISYTKRDVDEALAPTFAYLSVGLSLLPAFLDFKMRTAPLEYADDHYGRYHYIEYDYGDL